MTNEERQRMARRRARAKARKRARRRKLILSGVLALFILLIAGVAVIAGIKIGNSRRQNMEAEAAQSAEALAESAAMEQAALEESKQAEAEAARSEEEAQAHQEDYENTQQALEEQTRQANIENSVTLKKIAAISVPSLSAYLAAQQTPQVAGQGHIVCIDAGHEEVDLLEQEPNAPGSDVMKQKVSSGTYGEASGLEEYQLVLMVALKVQNILQSRGYQVVMTRTDHSAQLSNIDRAEIANTSGAEIMVRIHANGVDDTSVKGALTFGPSSDNAYLSPELIASSQRLGTDVVNKFCERTGAQNRGYCEDDGLTGVNWTQIPVTYIEMGFMSNPDEDLLMADDNYQNLMAEGIANGIDAYFAGQ